LHPEQRISPTTHPKRLMISHGKRLKQESLSRLSIPKLKSSWEGKYSINVWLLDLIHCTNKEYGNESTQKLGGSSAWPRRDESRNTCKLLSWRWLKFTQCHFRCTLRTTWLRELVWRAMKVQNWY
jgi:hypothetical protein